MKVSEHLDWLMRSFSSREDSKVIVQRNRGCMVAEEAERARVSIARDVQKKARVNWILLQAGDVAACVAEMARGSVILNGRRPTGRLITMMKGRAIVSWDAGDEVMLEKDRLWVAPGEKITIDLVCIKAKIEVVTWGAAVGRSVHSGVSPWGRPRAVFRRSAA